MNAFTGLIKGQACLEDGPGLVPGYSASGQDVWVPRELSRGMGPGIVLSSVGARCGKTFLANAPVWGTVANTSSWGINPSWDPGFVQYVLNREHFWIKGGSAQPYVQVEPSLSQPVALLSKPRQVEIAEFLDRESTQIDALIAKQERLIELLAEKRQAIITHSVTKGLDPSAPTKPFGSIWFESLPIHWKHIQMKQTAHKITDGAHVSPETDNGEFDFVSTKDLRASGIDFHGALKTSPESYRYMVSAGCRPHVGDVLFSKDGTIGKTVVVEEDREFVVASSLIIIRPDRRTVHDKFLDFACQSKPVQAQVAGYAKGAGLPRLSIANLRRVQIPLPPLEEQIRIAEHLLAKTSAIDYLTARSEEAIRLLSERRSALISAAVTGKIDVREGVA